MEELSPLAGQQLNLDALLVLVLLTGAPPPPEVTGGSWTVCTEVVVDAIFLIGHARVQRRTHAFQLVRRARNPDESFAAMRNKLANY